MYCQKCGSELRQDAVFCEACGEKIGQQINPTKRTKGKSSKGIGKIVLIAIAAVIVIGVALLMGKTVGKKAINMNDYLKISFNGYDTVGTADVEFDYYAFLEDYGDELKYKSSAVAKEIGLTPCQAVEKYLDGELSKAEELINGDKISFYWTALEQTMMPEFNYELQLDTYTITVEGLTELREVDLFKDVEVSYSGYAPYLMAEVVNNSKDKVLSQFTYNLSNSYNIDNGDILVLTLTGSNQYAEEEWAKCLAEVYGIKAVSYEKEIVVEGCSEYVRELDALPEDLMEAMKAESEKVIYSLTSQWNQNVTIENVTFCGSYFFWCGGAPENLTYLIYKITVRENFPELGIDNYVDIYYRSKCANAVALADGTYSINSSNFYSYTNFDRYLTDTKWIKYFQAYETFQDLYNAELAGWVANSTYYTDVVIEE